MEKFTKQNLFLAGLAFLLLVIVLFTNLGLPPLRLEEPRRALVALEMLLNDNLIVPTVQGELYHNKPPLFNWAIIACYKLFGNYSEFAVRFPSAFSFLLIGVILFLKGKEYVCLSFGIYSGLLFLISADILFYFSILGEIDLFYALIIFGSFITLYSFYQSQHYYLLFISTYFLGALGTLTKGFPSPVVLGISLPVFFLYNKNFKKLFTLPHFLGITFYVIVVAGYFWMYSHYNEAGRFIQNLWWESAGRTVIVEKHRISFSFVKHLFVFPLRAPYSLIKKWTFNHLLPIFLKKISSKPLVGHVLAVEDDM